MTKISLHDKRTTCNALIPQIFPSLCVEGVSDKKIFFYASLIPRRLSVVGKREKTRFFDMTPTFIRGPI